MALTMKPGSPNLTLLATQVQEGSPGDLAGLTPFFDYVVSLNGVRLVSDVLFYRSCGLHARSTRNGDRINKKRRSRSRLTGEALRFLLQIALHALL